MNKQTKAELVGPVVVLRRIARELAQDGVFRNAANVKLVADTLQDIADAEPMQNEITLEWIWEPWLKHTHPPCFASVLPVCDLLGRLELYKSIGSTWDVYRWQESVAEASQFLFTENTEAEAKQAAQNWLNGQIAILRREKGK